MIADILNFLKELKKNNNREWFSENKPRYDQLKKGFEGFVNTLIPYLEELDPHIGIMDAKDCIFRINRDIRFSKDKTPYKNHFGAFISYEGRKSTGPGYYIHLEPGQVLLAAGVYMPEPEKLTLIREEIAYNGDELKNLLSSNDFKEDFQMEDIKLVRPPKGYSEDHPNIDLLKYKYFSAYRIFPDKTASSKDFEKEAKAAFEKLVPFNNFFYKALGL